MTTPVSLRVNGVRHTVTVEPEMPLLWVLRDVMKLKGTKYGCGIGACGACTVLADNTVIRACLVPAGQVGARHIRTIEDRESPILEALREAWRAEDVPQCGYCQPAQISAAAGLLLNNPTPDDAAIDEGLRGVVCRCGTYQRVRAAIHRAVRSLSAAGVPGSHG